MYAGWWLLSIPTALAYVNSGASVQLFEWSWSDVANECETYLGPKGFKTVQISPPMDHVKGNQWWTRYQPVSYEYISRSGDETAFRDMVTRCSASKVGIIVDAVINHMAAGSGVGMSNKTFTSRSFPGLYSSADFHHYDNNQMANCQVNNYNDKHNVQYCDLSGLPDLSTSSSYVQDQIASYINTGISWGISGIRIDAAKHQDATELATLVKKINTKTIAGQDFYIGQEVIGATGEAVQPSMYFDIGQVTEFAYADDLDYNIINKDKMIYLKDLGEKWGLIPDQYALVFTDNHDTQRNGRAQLTFRNETLYTLANVFMLAFPYGNVRLMSSYYYTDYDQGPPAVGVENGANCHDGKNWVCEHRWPAIGNMVAWRNSAGTADIANWQSGTANQIAFSRGSSAFVALNREEYSAWSVSLQTGLAEGKYCNVIVSDDVQSCPVVTVDSRGLASVSVPSLSAVAVHAGKRIA